MQRLSENSLLGRASQAMNADSLPRATLQATRAFAARIAIAYPTQQTIFFGSRARGTAHAESDADVAVVLKGSSGRVENVASIQGTSHQRFRDQWVTEGIMAPQNGLYVFARDHLFSSPSTAALAVMGRSANG